ncbi:MAG: CSLREA domain-containing protein [Chloroflexi bacterium]|nr:CSLREA domain-containing protein [Chloroflexota bacterium]
MKSQPLTHRFARRLRLFSVAVLAAGSLAAAPRAGIWATFVVNSTADAVDASPGDGVCATAAGECTLRAAIQETNALPGADVIIVPAGTYTLTVSGGGELGISDDLGLIGQRPGETIIDGNGGMTGARVFSIASGAKVRFVRLVITGGTAPDGGGIYNNGTLALTGSVVTGNNAIGGGGVFNDHTLSLDGSKITGNTAADRGGGIYSPSGSGVVIVHNSTLADNTANHGGGVFAVNGSSVTIRNSTVSGNLANRSGGGAWMNGGKLVVRNSTVSGNTSVSLGESGGGIRSEGNSMVVVEDSTITANTAAAGGGIYAGGASTVLQGTLLAGNSSYGSDGPDCWGTKMDSAGYNLVGNNAGCYFTARAGDQVGTARNPIDPRLGPLQDNGGPTFTHALLPDSPAIDAGNPADCALADQRGYPRPADGDGDGEAICDIGAYEAASTLPDFRLSARPETMARCAPGVAVYEVTIGSLRGFTETVTLSASGYPDGSTAAFHPDMVVPPGFSLLAISDTGAATAGGYSIEVHGAATSSSHSIAVGLNLYTAVPAAPVLLEPANGAAFVPLQPVFRWEAAAQTSTYTLEVAADPDFTQIVYTAVTSETDHVAATPLSGHRLYYWRVHGQNACGASLSTVFSFTTTPTDFTLQAAPATQAVCAPAEALYDVTALEGSDPVTLSTAGYPAGSTATFDPDTIVPPGNSTLTIGNTGAAIAGGYTIAITGTTEFNTHAVSVGLDLYTGAPDAPALLSPPDGATNVFISPEFRWTAAAQAVAYDLQVATDPDFQQVVYTASVTGTAHTPRTPLARGTLYYWRVRAQNTFLHRGQYSRCR